MTSTAIAMTVLTHPFQVLLVAMVLARLIRMPFTSPDRTEVLGEDRCDADPARSRWMPGIA
jgi:hypothetical protein